MTTKHRCTRPPRGSPPQEPRMRITTPTRTRPSSFVSQVPPRPEYHFRGSTFGTVQSLASVGVAYNRYDDPELFQEHCAPPPSNILAEPSLLQESEKNRDCKAAPSGDASREVGKTLNREDRETRLLRFYKYFRNKSPRVRKSRGRKVQRLKGSKSAGQTASPSSKAGKPEAANRGSPVVHMQTALSSPSVSKSQLRTEELPKQPIIKQPEPPGEEKSGPPQAGEKLEESADTVSNPSDEMLKESANNNLEQEEAQELQSLEGKGQEVSQQPVKKMTKEPAQGTKKQRLRKPSKQSKGETRKRRGTDTTRKETVEVSSTNERCINLDTILLRAYNVTKKRVYQYIMNQIFLSPGQLFNAFRGPYDDAPHYPEDGTEPCHRNTLLENDSGEEVLEDSKISARALRQRIAFQKKMRDFSQLDEYNCEMCEHPGNHPLLLKSPLSKDIYQLCSGRDVSMLPPPTVGSHRSPGWSNSPLRPRVKKILVGEGECKVGEQGRQAITASPSVDPGRKSTTSPRRRTSQKKHPRKERSSQKNGLSNENSWPGQIPTNPSEPVVETSLSPSGRPHMETLHSFQHTMPVYRTGSSGDVCNEKASLTAPDFTDNTAYNGPNHQTFEISCDRPASDDVLGLFHATNRMARTKGRSQQVHHVRPILKRASSGSTPRMSKAVDPERRVSFNPSAFDMESESNASVPEEEDEADEGAEAAARDYTESDVLGDLADDFEDAGDAHSKAPSAYATPKLSTGTTSSGKQSRGKVTPTKAKKRSGGAKAKGGDKKSKEAKTKSKGGDKEAEPEKTSSKASEVKARPPTFPGWDIGGVIGPAPIRRVMEEVELTPLLLQRADQLKWGRRPFPDVDMFADAACQRPSQPSPAPLPPITVSGEHDVCDQPQGLERLYRQLGPDKPQILQEKLYPSRTQATHPGFYIDEKNVNGIFTNLTTKLVSETPNNPFEQFHSRFDHKARLNRQETEAMEAIRSVAQNHWDKIVQKSLQQMAEEEKLVEEGIESPSVEGDTDEEIMWGHDTDCDPMF